MTNNLNSEMQRVHRASATKRMHAVIGFTLIAIIILLLAVGVPLPGLNDKKYIWIVRLCVIVPFACAIKGIFFHFIKRQQYQAAFRKTPGISLGLVFYVIAPWLGSLLGWDRMWWG